MFQNGNPWFEECFEAAYQLMGILDDAGRIIRVNRAALAFTGLTQTEVVGIPLWLIPWPELKRQNRILLKRVIKQAAAGLASSRNELKIRPDKQTEKTIEFSIKPIQDEHGRIEFLFAEGRDITAYRQTREALFQSEARFRTIYEEAGIGIVTKSVNGKMLDCNPAFQDMVGYTAAELRVRDYLEITHPLDKRISRKLFNELIAGKRENYSIEKRYLHKNGEEVWGRITTSLVRDQSGVAKFVIGMVENITVNKQIGAELYELQQRLTQGREQERLRFAQDLHDGPLQEIIGLSYQVQELAVATQEAASRGQLQAIRAALRKLADSVRALCSELRPPTLAPFGLEKTIRSHLKEFQDAHPELLVLHKLSRDGRSLPDSTRIALLRIYQESLNNVLRHAKAKTVKVRFRLTAQKAVLEIQDDGVGFELPNRWVRLARQGHLGLVGAMERAKEVGGSLDVTTSPGRGTLIRVSVPVKENGFGPPQTREASQK